VFGDFISVHPHRLAAVVQPVTVRRRTRRNESAASVSGRDALK